MINFEKLCIDTCTLAKKAGEFIIKESKGFTYDKVETKTFNQLVSYVDKSAQLLAS